MAIPAIIGVAARSVGASLATGARIGSRAAYSGLKTGLVNSARGAIAAQRNPLLSRSLSVVEALAERRKQQREDGKSPEPATKQKPSNQEKSEQDERENKRRQEKAHEENTRKSDQSVSVLQVISKDTKDILAGIELLVEEGMPTKEKKGGLLSGLLSMLAGMTMFSKGFLPTLGGFLSKMALKMGSTVSGMITKSIGGILGTLGRAGGATGKAAAMVGKAAVGAAGALTARGALAARGAGAGAGAAKAAGTTGAMVGKAAGKSALKKIPLIGAGVGLALAANRAMAGDWVGAGMEATSGALSIVPGIGTVASLGVDAAILARDAQRARAGSGGGGPDFSKVISGASTTPTPKPTAHDFSQTPKNRIENLIESLTYTLRSMLSNMESPQKGIYVRQIDPAVAINWDELSQNPGQDTFSGPGAQAQNRVYGTTPSGSTISAPLSSNSSSKASGDVAGLLDLIAQGESGAAGYDAAWNGSRVKPSKPMSEMTFGEVMQWQRDTLNEQKSRGVPADRRSSAAGRYQFISGTLKSTMARAGFKEDDMFSPENQDKLAEALLDADKNRGLSAWRSGKASDADFVDYVASQWASVKNSSGRGQYNAAGFNHASIGGDRVISSLQSASGGKPSFANVITGSRPEAPVSAQMRESVVTNSTASRAPIVVSAPTTINQSKAPSGGSRASAGTPLVVRSPEHPVMHYSVAMLGVN